VAFSFLQAKGEAEALAREVGGIALHADLSEPELAPALVRDAAARLGGLDVLVLNAGVNDPKPFDALALDDLRRAERLHVESAFLAMQEAARVLPHGGRIVAVGSVAGVAARPGSVAYGASKAALHSLVRSVAEALAPRGIAVNAVAPGMIETGTHGEMMTPAFTSRIEAQVPMGRFGTADEVAECVLFFAAGPAYVTGQVLVMDGGIANVYFR
jgi:3-oxoacyl-[acyl-carrier protein] reductase